MDPTTDSTSSGTDAWFLSTLGQAISVYTDRTLNTQQAIQPSTGYGIDQNGQVYKIGQPTTVQTVAPVAGNGAMPILLLVGLFLLVKHHG